MSKGRKGWAKKTNQARKKNSTDTGTKQENRIETNWKDVHTQKFEKVGLTLDLKEDWNSRRLFTE